MRLKSTIRIFNDNVLLFNKLCHINSVSLFKCSSFCSSSCLNCTLMIDSWFKCTFIVNMFLLHLFSFVFLFLRIFIKSIYQFICRNASNTSWGILFCFELQLTFYEFLFFFSSFWIFVESRPNTFIHTWIMNTFLHNDLIWFSIYMRIPNYLLKFFRLLLHRLHFPSLFINFRYHLKSIFNRCRASMNLLNNTIVSFIF